MTRTRPWRRTTLHLSHILLTEGRTFIGNPFGIRLIYLHTQPQVRFFMVFFQHATGRVHRIQVQWISLVAVGDAAPRQIVG